MEIKIKKLHPNAKLPTYATDGSGCFDLYAIGESEYSEIPRNRDGDPVVTDGTPITFGTGIAAEVPEGHVMLVFSRSGHGFKNATRLANCVGVVDSDYRGEIAVRLTRDMSADRGLAVKDGDRIAQALIIPFPRVTFVEADALSSTERGAGGFGSTGQ